MSTRLPQEGEEPTPQNDGKTPGKGDEPKTPQRVPDPDIPGSFLIKGDAIGLGLAALLGTLLGFMLCKSTTCATCR